MEFDHNKYYLNAITYQNRFPFTVYKTLSTLSKMFWIKSFEDELDQ